MLYLIFCTLTLDFVHSGNVDYENRGLGWEGRVTESKNCLSLGGSLTPEEHFPKLSPRLHSTGITAGNCRNLSVFWAQGWECRWDWSGGTAEAWGKTAKRVTGDLAPSQHTEKSLQEDAGGKGMKFHIRQNLNLSKILGQYCTNVKPVNSHT